MQRTLLGVKTIQKVRAEAKADRKVLADQAFQRRLRARLLLFGKGRGKQKNLSRKEQKFVCSVAKECYEAYLTEFYTGKTRPWYQPYGEKWRRVHRNNPQPISRQAHRSRWYGSHKKRWIHYDVPNMMNQKFDLEVEDGK